MPEQGMKIFEETEFIVINEYSEKIFNAVMASKVA